MKRWIMIVAAAMLLLCLLCVFAGAEEETLFPARGEDELWGYINIRGEWIIKPQYESAFDYSSGGYALANSPSDGDSWGIIDRQGNWIVEPRYWFDDPYFWGDEFTGALILFYENEKLPDGSLDWKRIGFFDMESGYFSGMRDDWYIVPRYTESDLIPVHNLHREDERSERLGYVNRRTGELTIPFIYGDYANEPLLFHNGVAQVYYPDEYDSDGDPLVFLIDEQGNRITLEEGLQLVYGANTACDRVLVKDTASGLYGYTDTHGMLVIPAIYSGASEFQEGRARVWISGNEVGLIDTDGNMIVTSDQFDFIFDGFEHGYAPIMYNDEKKAWLSRDGRIIEKDPYCSRPVQENRFWVKEDSKSNYWHLEDDDGHLLSLDYELDIVNEFYFFSDGFVCVRNKEGLYGYLDENGQEVIPCQWDDVRSFHHGLACVVKNGKMAYINRQGKTIWQEQ